MALEVLPTWTIAPNWSSVVTETLDWLTGIMASTTGVEQRMQLRTSPRRSLEYTIQPVGEWRTYYDALLSTPQQQRFWVPLWYEKARMVRQVMPGETWITVQGTRAELAASTVLFLQGARPWSFELVEVAERLSGPDSTSFRVAAGVVNAWPRGTIVHPARKGFLTDQPSFSRIADRAVSGNIKFQFTEVSDWAGVADLPTYLGTPVLELPVNEDDTQGAGYDRLLGNLDNMTGIPLRIDVGGIPYQKFNSTTWFAGRPDADALRSLLYLLKGRCASAWLAYPMSDFMLAAPALAGANSIDVARSGFADLGGPVAGRQDVRIRLRNGVSLYHRITGTSLLDDETETLLLDPVLPVPLTPSAVQRISFMGLGRLDQDTVELAHRTDSDGVVGVSLAIKAVPVLRSATDWTPSSPPLGFEGGCGPTTDGQIWFRKNDEDWNASPTADPSFGFGGINISFIPRPWRIVGGLNTAFAFGDRRFKFNFGFEPFAFVMPSRAQAYDPSPLAAFDRVSATVNMQFEDLDRTIFTSGAKTGEMAKSISTTHTQGGLRYFEALIVSNSQDNVMGICNESAVMGSGGGTFQNADCCFATSNGTVNPGGVGSSYWPTGLTTGDVFCCAIYTTPEI